MKERTIFTFLICMNLGIWTFAQSLSPEIISANGSVDKTSSMSIEWTLGEIMISSSQKDKVLLTEGFHQPLLNVMGFPHFVQLDTVKLNDSNDGLAKIKVWPNPVDEVLSIQAESSDEQIIFVECYTSAGEKVMQRRTISPNEISKINLGKNPSGLYYLNFFNSEREFINSLIIYKL